MFIPSTQTWFSADDARLRALVAEGLRTNEIAELMGRTRLAIQTRMTRTKTRSLYSAKTIWLPEQDEMLKALVADRKTATQIAAIIGKSKNAVIGRMHRTGVRSPYLNQHNIKRPPTTRAERAARSRERWEAFEKRNGGGVVSALKSTDNRVRKATRNESARQMMRHHIVCAGDACHFTERPDYGSHFHTHCCWPVYEDSSPYSEKNSCCNRVEPGKPYCAAHQKLATEYVAAPFVQLPNRKGAVTIVPHHWKRDSWRAA